MPDFYYGDNVNLSDDDTNNSSSSSCSGGSISSALREEHYFFRDNSNRVRTRPRFETPAASRAPSSPLQQQQKNDDSTDDGYESGIVPRKERPRPAARRREAGGSAADETMQVNQPAGVDEGYDDDYNYRCILHADVDCFYCQCEHLDKNIPWDRPLGIVQKHIIVTCNYAARQCGVTKLQYKDDAVAKCPSLYMVDGSDLERYRIHFRKIYASFRRACKSLLAATTMDDDDDDDIAVCKGHSDEMMADLSPLLMHHDLERAAKSNTTSSSPPALQPCEEAPYYVYGEQTSVSRGRRCRGAPNKESSYDFLHRAAVCALEIRRAILRETGMTTTLGISVNPLLAKVASGLKKPATVNVLYPCYAPELLASMPLRNIHGIGSATIKALRPCLEAWHFHGSTHHHHDHQQRQSPPNMPKHVWTCRDLLQVPSTNIVKCLGKVDAFQKSSEEQACLVLQLCRGLDKRRIVDDQGGLPKTVSVENSFRRGTIRTEEQVFEGMQALYRRLPRLLRERKSWSTNPELAYPTTIRLVVRFVVVNNNNRTGERSSDADRTTTGTRGRTRHQSSLLKSAQTGMHGKKLFDDDGDEQHAAKYLRQVVAPLVRSIIMVPMRRNGIDVTRVNIAVTNFRDVPEQKPPKEDRQQSQFFPPASRTPQGKRRTQDNSRSSPNVLSQKGSVATAKGPPSPPPRQEPEQLVKVAASCKFRDAERRRQQCPPSDPPSVVGTFATVNHANEIDPSVLAELPADIAAEVQSQYRPILSSKPGKRKEKRIDQFYIKKERKLN